MRWHVIIPLKSLKDAKSRTRLPARLRGSLAVAMLQDTVAAFDGSSFVAGVTVVCAEPPPLISLGQAEILPVSSHGDLNDQVMRAKRMVVATSDCSVAVAVGDLPALTSQSVADVLKSSHDCLQSFVPDAQLTGTTMVMAPGGVNLRPAFGSNSARMHAQFGPAVTGLANMRAALDVDTLSDLSSALRIGVGEHTLAWVREHFGAWSSAQSGTRTHGYRSWHALSQGSEELGGAVERASTTSAVGQE